MNNSLKTKKKALILGAYGVGNVGDEAILSGLLKTLNYAEIVVFSSNPNSIAALHKVPAERKNLRRFLWCDDVIIGGGELFQDGMAWKYSLATILAKLLNKKVKVVGVGVNLRNPIEKLLTALSLRIADEISVRDKRSYKILIKMSLNPNKIIFVKDLVFNLKPEPTPEINFFLAKHNLISTKFIVIVLSPKDTETDKRVLTFFTKFIDNLTQSNLPLRIVIIPFSRHPDSAKDDDMIIIQELMRNLKNASTITFDGQPDPLSLLYLISKADLVISTRLHPLIFSDIANTKAIAIPFFPKIRSFAKKHGYPIVEIGNLEKLYVLLDKRFGTSLSYIL
jgi:polysaccharide pyruvyl transferase CsaB